MTDKTFWTWVNRYAQAVKELSWVGGIANSSLRAEAKEYWYKEKKIARQHINQALDDLVS